MTNRQALLDFGLGGSEPHWSSESLRAIFEARAPPGAGSLEDAIISLVALLGQPDGRTQE